MKRIILAAIALTTFTASTALSQPQVQTTAKLTPSDIAKAMDQTLGTLTIHDEELPDVLQRISSQAHVPITVDDDVLSLLPWGSHTKLKDVKIENATLRQALTQILSALGLTFEVRDASIVVMATEPIVRINRRATWEDIALLNHCRETAYTPDNLAKIKIQYRITSKVDAPGLMKDQLARVGQGTVAEILEVATGALGWVWFPDGDHIVIRTRQAQIANKLAKRVTMRYTNEPLSRILMDLATRGDVALNLEPGMMLKLPPQTAQSYTLLLNQASIRQALELICAETGLKYEIQRDGIYVGLSDQLLGGSTGVARTSGYVGKITIPSADKSYSYEFLLRESDLPPDLLEHRRQVIEDYIEKMRRDLAPEERARNAGKGE